MKTFEDLLLLANQLNPPRTNEERRIEWCDDGRILGLACQASEARELFVVGREYTPLSPIVRRHMAHGSWRTEDGTVFEANRVVLPSPRHFVAVSAFLAEELLRNGVSSNHISALRASEPLIEMALRRGAMAEEQMIGLLGELRVLEHFLGVSESPEQRARCIEAWRGFQQSSRDFVFGGSTGFEVKTTQANRSLHHVNNVRQVDPQRQSGEPTEHLYIASLGVQQSEPDLDGAFTLPSLVEDVLKHLGPETSKGRRNEIQELVLERIASYGGAHAPSYLHDDMKDSAAYGESWIWTFMRIYSMNDDAVATIRRSTLSEAVLVPIESVKFEIDLPETIGSENPIADPHRFSLELLRKT